MADQQETKAEETKASEVVSPHGEDESKSTDWKAEARKWEARAKQNSDAATELEKLKRERMSDLERAQADAALANAELERLKAENEMSAKALEISESSGIPASMLMHCADVEHMAAFADEWKKFHSNQPQPHAAPTASATRIVYGGEQKLSHGDIFANLFTN